jgi:hypothetical protein
VALHRLPRLACQLRKIVYLRSSPARHSRALQDGSVTLVCFADPRTDAKFPTAAFDEDITANSIDQHPFASTTPTLYLSYLVQIASSARNITDRVFAIQMQHPTCWSTISQLNDELNQIVERLPQGFAFEWVGEIVMPLLEQRAALDMLRVHVWLRLLQQVIRLNRPLYVAR